MDKSTTGQRLAGVLIAPKRLFEQLKEHPGWFLPWLVLSIAHASVQLGFYLLIDPRFLMDQLVAQSLRPGISESDLRALLQTTVDNRSVLAISSALGAAIGLLVTMAISAAYLYLLAKLDERELAYRKWFALTAWCSLPGIFSALAGWAVILSAGGRIEFTAMSPLNLNTLVFGADTGLASAWPFLDLTTIWTLVLLVLGYRSFTASSGLRASIVVLFPCIALTLLWILLIPGQT